MIEENFHTKEDSIAFMAEKKEQLARKKAVKAMRMSTSHLMLSFNNRIKAFNMLREAIKEYNEECTKNYI